MFKEQLLRLIPPLELVLMLEFHYLLAVEVAALKLVSYLMCLVVVKYLWELW
jgi:hypothetical protein